MKIELSQESLLQGIYISELSGRKPCCEVEDDGKGIDEKVRKIVDRGSIC